MIARLPVSPRCFLLAILLAAWQLAAWNEHLRADGAQLAEQRPGAGAEASAEITEDARNLARAKATEAARLLEQGDWQRALAAAREAVEADGTSAQAHYVLAMSYEAGGDLRAAEQQYKLMGPFAPEPLLELSLARLYLREGRLAEAEENARAAVEKNRWIPQPYLTLGAVSMRRRNYAGAIDAFRKAVEKDPRGWNSRISLGDAYRGAGQWDEALAEYTQALAMKPEHPEALLGRALTWEQMGREREAIGAYGNALAAVPNLLAARHNLAKLLLNARDTSLRDPKRALELAVAAAEATGHQNAEILETLSEAYLRTGDPVRSEEMRRKAKEAAPPPRETLKTR